jgi:murein DD-endopeptidase MepM/ murein hydrolase activator NlpD
LERASWKVVTLRALTSAAILALFGVGLFAGKPVSAGASSKPSKTSSSPVSSEPSEDRVMPVAGAFVYPVGDELDYRKRTSGSGTAWYVSDPYLALRGSKKQRTHYGVDLSCGRGGDAVRAIGSGVVTVADGNALVKVTTKKRVKVPVTAKAATKGTGAKAGAKGAKPKKTYKTVTKTRTSWKWRTGWGNYVVIRHLLPSGETVYSLYAHLAPKSVKVKAGDVVAAGEPIGKVGKTGRANSPHLHLEVRRSAPARDGDTEGDEEDSTAETRTFARLDAVDPLAFLDGHVRRFEDLEPGSWESRYALAACRDGLAFAGGDEFEPEDAVTRGDYYASLVSAFGLSTSFPSRDWSSTLSALVDAGVVSAESAREERERETLTRSEALEILLRCLDSNRARAHNLGSLDAMTVSRDFNRQFAGSDAADRAEREAKSAAAEETRLRKKAEADRVAKARKASKAAGKTSRVKAKPVPPVKPVPVLDPGFESLAQSEKKVTRAEVCLLLATAMRPAKERYSALQRAAIRVAQSG